MITIVEQLQQNFQEKILVRKYFAPLLFVWNVFPSSKVKYFGDKIYFTGWSQLLKIFIEIATLQIRPQFLSLAEISFCDWSVNIFQFLFSTCLVKIVEGKLSERPD